MKSRSLVFLCIVIALSSLTVHGQQGFFTAWEHRVRVTSSQQPGWPVPVFSPSSGLVQLVRFDAVRQYTPTRATVWNMDGGKGFNLIPWYKTELDFNLPPFLEHSASTFIDGPGDFSLLAKYRVLAANEEHGAYSISAGLGGTVPTGSYKNGAAAGTISPTIFAGKGFGFFNVQTAASEMLPAGHTSTIGRPIAWNTALQAKVKKIFWPEVEFNSTFNRGGTNNGKDQTFVSPGFLVSKIRLTSNETSRLAVIFGGGEQIAVTHYHAYNHALSFTSRVVF
jgi:Putative MetA-pathway of phenol degradation